MLLSKPNHTPLKWKMQDEYCPNFFLKMEKIWAVYIITTIQFWLFRINRKPGRRSAGDPGQKMISRPARMPPMAEKAGSLLWYIRMDWGRISPKTTYSMAPLAKPRLSVRPRGPISPSR